MLQYKGYCNFFVCIVVSSFCKKIFLINKFENLFVCVFCFFWYNWLVKEKENNNLNKTADRRIKVLIDTDAANEIDDQFALAYALSCQDVLNVLGVTIAPFRVSWQKNLSVRDGMIDSKNEVNRILRLFGIKNNSDNPFVYLGCDGFLSEGYDSSNSAVEKILELAKKHSSFIVCCLGTLTNVAMALRIKPSIASKLKVIWLGTDNVLLEKFEDANYRKDIVAFNEVVTSKVDLTIFPTYLARTFVTSTYEFSKNIKGNNVSKYLSSIMDRFVFTEENMGIKTIYDIGPVAYLLHKSKFAAREVGIDVVLKDKNIAIDSNRKINYVVSVPKNSFVWIDFLKAINSNKNYYLKPNIFFTADTHFNSESKVKRRLVPFKTVDEMNRELIKRWNNVVGSNDIVYHIGDFGDYEFIKKLNGKVTLICGNYEEDDFGKNFEKFRENLLTLGFAEVIKEGLYLDEKILGERVYLTHMPTKKAKDCYSVFGHVHNLSLVKKFGFNVCVCYHYYAPINLATAKNYLEFVKGYADADVFI